METKSSMKAIIVDIDGTLADITHRAHFVNNANGKKDWGSFNRTAHRDALKTDVAKAVDLYYAAGIPVILVTGRFQAMSDATTKWLHKHNVRYSALFMRPDGDYRSDHIIKEEIYLQQIKARGFEVIGAFDDRDRVVEMWRKLGLTCFQVQRGDY
jgi:uncharacterized HAD superfamily protein